jgi:hypothetical protein
LQVFTAGSRGVMPEQPKRTHMQITPDATSHQVR